MRKYKPQRIGINPEWVKKYITAPAFKISIVGVIILIAFMLCTDYAKYKAQEELEQIEIQESISAEESIIAESKRAKEQARIEEEAKKESLAKIEVETRRTNTLYENQVSKKVVPVGTYLRNSKINKVGRVTGYYGLEVITNNDWNFNIDTNGNIPEEITMIGYAEYSRTLKKQKEQEEKKNRLANAEKIQQLIEEDLRIETEKSKAYLGNYNHFILNGKKYRIIKIVGNDLIVLEKYKKNKKYNYETIELTSQIKPIGYVEYETEKP